MTLNVAIDEPVVRSYTYLSPDAEAIRTVAYRWGGRRRARRAADYLGLDLLSGGVRQVVAVAERLGVREGDTVLEIGCGLGGPLRHVAERYRCKVTGVDVTERQLQIARALTAGLAIEPQVEFVLADARALPFADDSFSQAYSIEAFVHISDKPAALRETFRVLAPEGPLVVRDFIVHDPSAEFALFDGAIYPLGIEDYLKAFREAGFEDVVSQDRTGENREAYAVARAMYGDGPLRIADAFATIEMLQPGVRPSLRRYLSPRRAPYLARYARDRSRWARDLFGTQERLDGVRRMCDDIVAAYDSGAMSFYELSGRKPLASRP